MPKIIDRDEVRALLEAGDATLVEALPKPHYDKEHLPGAINIPHDQVDTLAGTLLPDTTTPVIVYCANEPCPNSGIAARRLETLGYQHVYDYGPGKEDWVTAGLPTEP